MNPPKTSSEEYRETSNEYSESYWEEYYETNERRTPSPFVKWCMLRTEFGKSMVDLGCGDGEDTDLIRHYHPVIGIDSGTEPKGYSDEGPFSKSFIKGDILDAPEADYYYARFLFHAIPEELEDKLLDKISGTLLLETRIIGDDSFEDDHYRRLIDPEKFKKKLAEKGFEILEEEQGRGLAPYKGQDPLVMRIIAIKEATK